MSKTTRVEPSRAGHIVAAGEMKQKYCCFRCQEL